MKNQTKQPQQNRGSSDRRDYQTPNLKEFGSVGKLTQAGTQMGSEMGAIDMAMA